MSINGTIPSLSIFDSWAKGLVPIPQGAVQVEQDCLNHRSSVYGVDDDATKRENTHRRSAPLGAAACQRALSPALSIRPFMVSST